ncbi:hypothetical protein ALC62_13131, partial [Cyphomyrmex costatus]
QEVIHAEITLTAYVRCRASRNGDEDLHNLRDPRYPGRRIYTRKEALYSTRSDLETFSRKICKGR